MKKLIALLAAVSAVVIFFPTHSLASTIPFEAELYAGQTTLVGVVQVWNDATNLYAKYKITNTDWCLTETHLQVAKSLDGIPQAINKKTGISNGNPIPGQFEYGENVNCQSDDLLTIPLSDLGLSGEEDLIIAAHAVVFDKTSLTTIDIASHADDNVFGPLYTYALPQSSSWGTTPLSAVIPSFASAGVWPTISGADWVSTALVTEQDSDPSKALDSWRKYVKTFSVPTSSYIIPGAGLDITADNAEGAYLNGTLIGHDGVVNGPFVDNYEWKTILPYTFNPVIGNNKLEIVWRNYDVGSQESSNPNGVIYKGAVQYYTRSESAWAGENPFSGSNWATSFIYHLTGSITFDKVVVDGNAPDDDWTFTISGGNDTAKDGDVKTYNTGSYTVSESGPLGYTLTEASGVCSLSNGIITLDVTASGGTCTITNKRDTGSITFDKVVVDGNAPDDDWTFTISGGNGTAKDGDTKTYDTDSYTMTESGSSDYTLTGASGACSLSSGVVTLDVTTSGGTCTITNTSKYDAEVRLENKDGSYVVIPDGIYGILKYNSIGDTFDYQFKGYGLTPGTNWSLIYYADGWAGNHPGYYFGSASANGLGELTISGNPDLGMDLPAPIDANHPTGAKIWLVPTSAYNSATKSLTSYPQSSILFETDWVNYTDTNLTP